MIVVFSGLRDLAPESRSAIVFAVGEEIVKLPAELRFGGALGCDHAALAAAIQYRHSLGDTRLTVVVPFMVGEQPVSTREQIREAHRVVEMRLERSKAAYLRRNDTMLAGDRWYELLPATKLVAFTDGRETGGTAYTIRKARELGIETKIVAVRALDAT